MCVSTRTHLLLVNLLLKRKQAEHDLNRIPLLYYYFRKFLTKLFNLERESVHYCSIDEIYVRIDLDIRYLRIRSI